MGDKWRQGVGLEQRTVSRGQWGKVQEGTKSGEIELSMVEEKGGRRGVEVKIEWD